MGRKAGLTRDEVLDEATAVVDADGLEAATLGAVAERLGIKTPSLYHYFEGTAGLRRALALRAVAGLGLQLRRAATGRSGPDAVRQLARAYRQFAARHPGLYSALLPAPKPKEDAELYAAMADVAEIVAAVLAYWQLPKRQVVGVIRALRSTLHGFVALEGAQGFGMPVDLDRSFEVAVDLFIAGLGATLKGRAPESAR